MKKLSLLMVLALLVSVFSMAASSMELARLTFINKSGHVVYLRLEGREHGQFYYLTVPKGTREAPEEITYTVVRDFYDRTTWYGEGDFGCEGVQSSGELEVSKKSKFVFTPCNQFVESFGEPSWGEKIVYFKVFSKSYKSPNSMNFVYQY